MWAVWKVIRPKLEVLIAEEKARRLEAAKQERLIAREDEFELFWEFFLDNLPSVLGKDLIPTIGDAYELATVVDMLADDDAHATITQERFLARKEDIVADIAEYQIRIKRGLVKLFMSQPAGGTGTQDATSRSENEEVDFSILDRAATLFQCDTSNCHILLPYPDIFDHEHVRELPSFSFMTLSRLQPEPTVVPIAVQLLKALGLPKNTPAAALDSLLMCFCGHPRYRWPVDFGTLVSVQVAGEARF